MQSNRERLSFLLNGLTYVGTAALCMSFAAFIAIAMWRFANGGSVSSGGLEYSSAILGALVGGLVPLGWAAYARSRERSGEAAALIVEAHQAEIYLDALLNDAVPAPLYRFPTAVLVQALPKLIGDGVLSLNDTGVLVGYLNSMEELNRGLDRCGDAHAQGDAHRVTIEFGRVQAKAEKIRHFEDQRWNGHTLQNSALRVIFVLRGGGSE